MRVGRGAAAILASAALAAQDPPPAATGSGWVLSYSYFEVRNEEDYSVWMFSRGVLLRRGGVELRAREAVIHQDIDALRGLAERAPAGPPRRGAPPASARRVHDDAELERRMRSLLAAAGQRPPAPADVTGPERGETVVDLNRAVYLEGDVSLFDGGLEVLRADALYASAIDDRVVLRGVELRLPNVDPVTGARRFVTVRGDELVRQGPRLTGRDVSITTSVAGAPHFEIVGGEVELIERGTEFEVRGRGNSVRVFGSTLARLPDVHFFTSQPPPFPIKGLSGGYGSKEGPRVEVEFGSTWNGLGGRLHEMLTGDTADAFRGEWRLGVGFNSERGIPIEPELEYAGGDLYRGRTRAFLLDDQGRDRGPVQADLDGGPIATGSRRLVRSENRVFLGPDTRLDLELFSASDPAVLPEFHQGEWLQSELPETHAMLRTGHDNWLATVSGRFDLDGVAYDDARRLAPRFLEQLPLATFDVFSEPLLTLPGDAPLLLTASSGAGLLRWDRDRLATALPREDALRLDQELELAAPFAIGDLWVRPFGFGRATWYSDSPAGDEVARWIGGAGVRAGLELARTWRWQDGTTTRALRHVINPEVGFVHRAHASKSPGELFQFDATDTLDEDVTLRVGVLNRLLASRRRGADPGRLDEPVWLDLAQNFKPLSERDNGGELLGLAEYELILRPGLDWPLPNLMLFVEGEHDWNAGDERTFNVGTRFGKVAGIDWNVEYREDRVREGVLIGGATTELWSRWLLQAGSGYDLAGEDVLWYQTMLVRRDLDWTVRLGVTYDTLNAETSLFLRFEPTLGGFVEARERVLMRSYQGLGTAFQGY